LQFQTIFNFQIPWWIKVFRRRSSFNIEYVIGLLMLVVSKVSKNGPVPGLRPLQIGIGSHRDRFWSFSRSEQKSHENRRYGRYGTPLRARNAVTGAKRRYGRETPLYRLEKFRNLNREGKKSACVEGRKILDFMFFLLI
jgi:hypothetical protein